MRILFTFVGGRGHFEPLVPIARAAAEAGHVVVFGCAPAMVEAVQAAGFAVRGLGSDRRGPPERLPLLPLDREREERDLRDRFVRRAARYRVPLIASRCAEWRPDVLVCDETDFGAAVAAEHLGLPFATVLVTATGAFVRAEVVGAALDELRAEYDLPPDPELSMLYRHLVLSPFPASLRDPSSPLPATALSFRLPTLAPGDAPAWSRVRAGAPRVYLTLGTVFHLESGDLMARLLAGVRELPVNAIATVGPGIDPAELGPQPPQVRIERYVPQATLLPHCDLVVSHGGSGSVLGALAHGLPSVLVPIGADQPLNAERCLALGVAEVLDASSLPFSPALSPAMEPMPERVKAAVAKVLGDPAYRRNALRVRDEIAALPDAAHAVRRLEELAAGHAGR